MGPDLKLLRTTALDQWFPKSYSEVGTAVSAGRGGDWGRGVCPTALQSIAPLRAPRIFRPELGCHTGLWKGVDLHSAKLQLGDQSAHLVFVQNGAG